jgi:zinc and cadmium transporter
MESTMKSSTLFLGGTALLVAIVAVMHQFTNPLFTYAVGSVLLVGEVSLMGVFALSVTPQTLDTLTRCLVSLATGAMLGNAFVHLIPESFENVASQQISAFTVSMLMSAGFLISFVLERGLNFRCHHAGGCHHDEATCCQNDQGDEHGPRENHGHRHIHPTGHLSLMAHGLDNFTDGMLIGVAYMINPASGLAMTLAIVAHEIPMEFGGFGVLVNAGFSRFQAVAINFCSALVALGGTLMVLILGTVIKSLPVYFTPFGTGIAVYIVAAGLIPMMREERNIKRALMHSGILLIGFAAMAAAKLLEGYLGA